jgi:hypothetical protein
MEDGGWRMEDGGWRMEDGGWRMEDGGWRMEDGGNVFLWGATRLRAIYRKKSSLGHRNEYGTGRTRLLSTGTGTVLVQY